MVLCLLILGAILPFHQRLKQLLPDGVLGLAYFGVYALGRFFLSYFRLDMQIILGLRQAQIASLLMVVIAVIAIPILFRRASTTSAPAQATASGA
jgi:prolipoprotein diacylglyceryltransferase